MSLKIFSKLVSLLRNMVAFPMRIILRFIAFIWHKDSKKIVIGGWMGELYCDNPKYLLQYLLQNTEYQITWIGKEAIRNQLPRNKKLVFARKGSLLAFWKLLNAKTWVCCQAINIDLTDLPILGRGICIDLWHGIPIKYIGDKTPHIIQAKSRCSLLRLTIQKLKYNFKSWLVVSNNRMVDLLCDGVPTRYNRERILPVGTPRNDFLIQNCHNEVLKKSLREKYSSLLGFDPLKRIVMYLPTWRMSGDAVFTFYNQDLSVQKDWKLLLDKSDAVLIEKHHWGTYSKHPIIAPSQCSIPVSANQQRDIDIQELLLITDILISDYSGAYIDFALLKRPVIHFAYDFESYASKDSGLAYNLDDVVAGAIVKDSEFLKIEVERALNNKKVLLSNGYSSLVEFEQGDASKRIVDFIESKASKA